MALSLSSRVAKNRNVARANFRAALNQLMDAASNYPEFDRLVLTSSGADILCMVEESLVTTQVREVLTLTRGSTLNPASRDKLAAVREAESDGGPDSAFDEMLHG